MDACEWRLRYTNEVLSTRTNICPFPDAGKSWVTDYWAVGGATGAVTQFIGNSRYGVFSLQRTVTSTASARLDWVNTTSTIPAVAGQAYTVSVFVRSSVARTCRVNLDWRNSGGASISVSNGATATSTTTGYTRVSLTATAPANTVSVRIQLEVTNAVSGDTHWWSNVLLENGLTLLPYFDGTRFEDVAAPQRVTKVAWNGSFDISTSTQYLYNWYDLANISEVSIFKGRRNQIDDYTIDTASVDLSQIPAWSPEPKRGNRVELYVYRPGLVTGITEFNGFYGRISDIQIERGLLPAMDTASINIEGIQAEWSRAQINGVTFAAGTTDEVVLTLSDYTTLNVAQFGGRSTTSAITFSGSALEMLNLVTRTEEARMFSYASNGSADRGNPVLWWYGRNVLGSFSGSNLEDGADKNPAYLVYDRLVFRSSAEEYFNQVTIEPDSGTLIEQTATLGESPLFSLVKQTVDSSNDQALQHANYLLGQFQASQQLVSQVSLTDRMQRPTPTLKDNVDFLFLLNPIGNRLTIKFRGSAYEAVVEGVQISARLDETRITLMLSSADTNAYLILDDATFGRLDFNKLGF